MAKGTKRYWLSFDLGLRGDYEELYAWLDRHKARECGDNVATFTSKRSRAEIARELAETLAKGNPRLYIIDRQNGGKFLLGKRKVAAWTGYAEASVTSGEEK